jgi:hypothetical protein
MEQVSKLVWSQAIQRQFVYLITHTSGRVPVTNYTCFSIICYARNRTLADTCSSHQVLVKNLIRLAKKSLCNAGLLEVEDQDNVDVW